MTEPLVARLAAVIDEHAREADWEASVGGRPDLWPEVDVPLALVRDSHTELARLQAENEALRRERDEALDRADELEASAEVVSAEFEKDCWKAMRRLLDACNFPWRDLDPWDGVTANDAEEHIKTTLDEMEKAEQRAVAAREAAEAKAARLKEALGKVREKAQAGMTPSAGLTREDRALAACSFIEEMSRAALEA